MHGPKYKWDPTLPSYPVLCDCQGLQCLSALEMVPATVVMIRNGNAHRLKEVSLVGAGLPAAATDDADNVYVLQMVLGLFSDDL